MVGVDHTVHCWIVLSVTHLLVNLKANFKLKL